MANPNLLQIDNTSFHRLDYIAHPDLGRDLGAIEHANILHVLECLVLGDALALNAYEPIASQSRSDELRAWLDSSDLRGLVTTSSLSTPVAQKEIAADTAREMEVRKLFRLEPSSDSDAAPLVVAFGRPLGTLEVAGHFWRGIVSTGASADEIRERADQAVETYRTDGLFIYGVAQHDDIIETVRDGYRRGAALSDDDWGRLHVIFRTLFNQQMTDRQHDHTYAPPPSRAAALRVIYEQPLTFFDASASAMLAALATKYNRRSLAEDLIDNAEHPLPLLGLAYLEDARRREPQASFLTQLALARELAAPLRPRLGRLTSILASRPGDYLREAESEAAEFDEIVREKLGLQRTGGLELAKDEDVEIDFRDDDVKVDVSIAARAIEAGSRKLRDRQRRVRVAALSDGLVRTLRYDDIGNAVRSILSEQ